MNYLKHYCWKCVKNYIFPRMKLNGKNLNKQKMKKYIKNYIHRLTGAELVKLLNKMLDKRNVGCVVKYNELDVLSADFPDTKELLNACPNYDATNNFYVLFDDGEAIFYRSLNDIEIFGRRAIDWLADSLVIEVGGGQFADNIYASEDIILIAKSANVLPTKEVQEWIERPESIYFTEGALLWHLSNKFPELRTRVQINCLKQFQQTWQFAEQNNITDSLIDCFWKLSNWNNPVIVMSDYGKHCFTFRETRIDDPTHAIFGGIIFHGTPETGYLENGSCSLTPTYGWSIHT